MKTSSSCCAKEEHMLKRQVLEKTTPISSGQKNKNTSTAKLGALLLSLKLWKHWILGDFN